MSTATAIIPRRPARTAPTRRGDLRAVRSTAFSIFMIDVGLVILFTILSPGNRFGSLANFESLMHYTMVALLLALGMTMVVAAEMIDLSLGANLILSSVFGVLTLEAMGGTRSDGTATGTCRLVFALSCACHGTAFGIINGLLFDQARGELADRDPRNASVGTGIAGDHQRHRQVRHHADTSRRLRCRRSDRSPPMLVLVIALVLGSSCGRPGSGFEPRDRIEPIAAPPASGWTATRSTC